MFIETETTSSPARMKFRPDCEVMPFGTAGFLDGEGSARSPLAHRLFGIDGVTAVYLDPETIAVTKSDQFEWPMMKIMVIGAIVEHFSSVFPVILDEDQPMPRPGLDTAEGKTIQKLVEQRINPRVASHGGSITLIDVHEDTVFIRMEGGCQGCAMASVTLKQGVATEIQAAVPKITTVQDVTDHASGANPYQGSAKGGGATSPYHQPGK
jgi:Fe-S cluster biogenesis protein NfuA